MRPADVETLDLIRRCQAGDELAFAGIFHKYKNLVYKTAYLMLGNGRDAEDTLQDVFLELYRSLRLFNPAKAAFSTWLYRVTINDCLNWRRKRRLVTLSLDEVNEPAAEAHGVVDPDVWRAVSRLSPKLRAVVVLRYYGDLSYAELTEVLDIPLGTVKSRLHQALSVVKEDLAEFAELEARRVDWKTQNQPHL